MKILGLEIGECSIQAAVLDTASATPVGRVERVEYAVDHPTPAAAEVPAERLWAALTATARRAAASLEGIAGVGLACATPALVLLDARDRPLGPIWMPQDRRARAVARQTWAAVGAEFLRTTGARPLPGGMSVLSYRQQLQQDPYLSHRVASYLHLNGWIGLRLTGERAFDPANASCTGLFNTLADHQWSRKWCDYFDVEQSWLPPVLDGATTLGPLRSAVAAELGVAPGIPVKLGMADASCAILGAGLRTGDLLHWLGSTQLLVAVTDRPLPDPRRMTRLLGVGAGSVHLTHNPVGWTALEWVRTVCYRELSVEAFYEAEVPAALERSTRVTLDPPDLAGDQMELESRRAAFRDLTLATDRIDLLAALVQEMRRQHQRAIEALGVGQHFGNVVWMGRGSDIVKRLLPEYPGAAVHQVDEGPLRGIARLFQG